MLTDKRTSVNTTKQTIFMASAELFAQNGYGGVSMKEIAQKAGITASSIYNHYKNKQEIMDELLQYYLDRMEIFYDRLTNTPLDKDEGLNSALDKLMLAYEAHERLLMYYLTRIVHHEQFSFPAAAEALIGEGYRKYVNAHTHYIDRLVDAGLISGKEDSRFYGEIYARLSITFAINFLHPEIEPTISDQVVLSDMLKKLIISHEGLLLQQDKRAGKAVTARRAL